MKTKLFSLIIIALSVTAMTACNKLSTPGADYENITADISVTCVKHSETGADLFPIVEVAFKGANVENSKGLRMYVEYDVDGDPAQVICRGNAFAEKDDNGTKWLEDNPNGYVAQNSQLYVSYRSNHVYYTYFTIPCLEPGTHTITMTFTTLAHANAEGDSGIGTKYTVTKTFELAPATNADVSE